MTQGSEAWGKLPGKSLALRPRSVATNFATDGAISQRRGLSQRMPLPRSGQITFGAGQRLRAEGVEDHLSQQAFGFASDTPSPDSKWITSGAGQRLRAEGVEDHIS